MKRTSMALFQVRPKIRRDGWPRSPNGMNSRWQSTDLHGQLSLGVNWGKSVPSYLIEKANEHLRSLFPEATWEVNVLVRGNRPVTKAPREIPDFWNRLDRSGRCWIWKLSKVGGYGQLCYRNQMWRAHRLSWTLTYGPIPRGLMVLHHCDRRDCVRPDHLFLGTHEDNSADAKAKGRAGRKPRLSARDVIEIRKRYRKGLASELAKEFGCSSRYLVQVARGNKRRRDPQSPL